LPAGLPATAVGQAKEAQAILTRTLNYFDKRFGLGAALDSVHDSRPRPSFATGRVLRSITVGLLSRVGSLNALDGLRLSNRQLDWVGGALPSADRLGDVAEAVDVNGLRRYSVAIYHRLRHYKGIFPLADGLRPLVLDAHESFASTRRCCPACLTRTLKTATGQQTQYYHRWVAAMLVHRDGYLMLDLEPLERNEGEAAAARRLLARLLDCCPQAFNVVCGDALYMDPGIWHAARDAGKHIVAVLKNENRDLMVDARSLFNETQPVAHNEPDRRSLWWDISGFKTWTQLGEPVRIVRSLETVSVRRQLTRKIEKTTTEWIWATSLPASKAGTASIVRIGHERWSIENQGFNELVNHWHADHCYKHAPTAILVFLLLLFIVYNFFHIFLKGNIKPERRRGRTNDHFASLIAAGLYAPIGGVPP